MSRIGKAPVNLPSGVEVSVADRTITVKGPKGTLSREIPGEIEVTVDGGVLTCTRPNDERRNRAQHGLTRSLVNNMVLGVTEGFKKNLEIVGVGYRAERKHILPQANAVPQVLGGLGVAVLSTSQGLHHRPRRAQAQRGWRDPLLRVVNYI